MTGMVTVSMISLIIWGSLILATPPCDRMSAGTRSRAMTAQAPASSAIRAWHRVLALTGCREKNNNNVVVSTHLLGVDNIHDDTTLQHPCKSGLDCEVVLAILRAVTVGGGEFGRHCVCV
jgi:Tfp pilus assembly protein PilX